MHNRWQLNRKGNRKKFTVYKLFNGITGQKKVLKRVEWLGNVES